MKRFALAALFALAAAAPAAAQSIYDPYTGFYPNVWGSMYSPYARRATPPQVVIQPTYPIYGTTMGDDRYRIQTWRYPNGRTLNCTTIGSPGWASTTCR